MHDPALPDPANSATAVGYGVALQAAGWKKIAHGNFAQVYHRSGDTEVIKVCELDQCYVAFAKYARANSGITLPKISILVEFKEWSVAHIEYLEELSAGNAFDLGEWWGQYKASICSQFSISYYTFNSHWKDWSNLANAFLPQNGIKGCGFDMKCPNAMQRGNGEIVFTDVLAPL